VALCALVARIKASLAAGHEADEGLPTDCVAISVPRCEHDHSTPLFVSRAGR
jgi:hypothetical protein